MYINDNYTIYIAIISCVVYFNHHTQETMANVVVAGVTMLEMID